MQGKQYFTCPDNYGIFIRQSQLTVLRDIDASPPSQKQSGSKLPTTPGIPKFGVSRISGAAATPAKDKPIKEEKDEVSLHQWIGEFQEAFQGNVWCTFCTKLLCDLPLLNPASSPSISIQQQQELRSLTLGNWLSDSIAQWQSSAPATHRAWVGFLSKGLTVAECFSTAPCYMYT